jgi:hypothetical protein
MNFKTLSMILVTLALGVGCNQTPAATTDSGTPGADTGAQDTGTPGTDTGTPGADTGTPGADAGSLVAQCQAMADTLATNCAGSAPRPCLWAGYRELCAIGNTQLLIDAMTCLDRTTCRTFSDSNGADACLATAHAAESSTVQTAVADICNACMGTGCSMPAATGEIIPYLSDADVRMIAACRGTACTIDAIVQACPAVPGLAPFVACTM